MRVEAALCVGGSNLAAILDPPTWIYLYQQDIWIFNIFYIKVKILPNKVLQRKTSPWISAENVKAIATL